MCKFGSEIAFFGSDFEALPLSGLNINGFDSCMPESVFFVHPESPWTGPEKARKGFDFSPFFSRILISFIWELGFHGWWWRWRFRWAGWAWLRLHLYLWWFLGGGFLLLIRPPGPPSSMAEVLSDLCEF